MQRDPHRGQPLLVAGEPLGSATAAVLACHGRGAGAADILGLAVEIGRPRFAYLAPQAAGSTWYPYSFLEAIERNQPWLDSALGILNDVLDSVRAAGIPSERIVLMGFSQGACLALEYAARNARRYGGLIGFSGGLIGPEGTPRDYPGSFAGTPAFLGCSDIDPHIPKARVLESAEVLTRLGAEVTVELYPDMGHTVSPDEVERARRITATLARGDQG